MNRNVFLFFSFVFLQIERERERLYKIGYKEKRSQSLLLFFSWWSSCGEYFLFYGLIDFMLFLILAWRTGSIVSEIFFSSSFTRSTWLLVPSATKPVQQLTFLLSNFSLTGRRCHFRFRVPANRLASTFFLPVSGDPSKVTKYQHLVSNVTHILS